ncbi:beta-propeller fold lactonase family protein [uncultured Methanospirillum sp.]|uniref:beta-propeller domain-containing protein n=1 Tax=uncultured Methanospirillum sp. TaxID=262503 RepID=UPI0029C89C20|nr:beta-propeller fold lactonase family protein [uncultured Methanospirillum sp.]
MALITLSILIFSIIPCINGATISVQVTNATSNQFTYTVSEKFGSFGSLPGELDQIADLEVGDDGTIYVSDPGNHQVTEFSLNGTYLRSIGGWVDGVGFTFSPGGIALDSTGDLYIADSGTDRILVFNPQGDQRSVFTISANSSTLHFGTRYIAVNSTGFIYVTEPVDKTMRVLDPRGNLIQTWNLTQQSNTPQSPGPMAIDEKGTIYMISPGSRNLLAYSPDGTRICDWSLNKIGYYSDTMLADLVIGPDGNLYCSASGHNDVSIMSTNGTLIDRAIFPTSSVMFPALAFSPDGDMVVGDSQTKKISLIHRTRVAGQSPPSGSSSHVTVRINVSPEQQSDSSLLYVTPVVIPVLGLKYPSHITYGDDKTLFISDYNGHTAYKTDIRGTILLTINNSSVPDGRFNNPGGIVRDSAGTIYIANQGAGRIELFSPDGRYLSSLGSHGNGYGQFNRPSGLAFGPDGSLYVADLGNNRIVRLDTTGRILESWGKQGIKDGEFREPWGITVDTAGMVYVTDSQNNRIQQFSSNGTWIRSWGSKGDIPGKFQIPMGIQIGRDGFLYVVDVNNYRIQKFYLNGTFIKDIIPETSTGSQKIRMNGLSLSSSGDIYTTNCYGNAVIKLEPAKGKSRVQPHVSDKVQSSRPLLASLFPMLMDITRLDEQAQLYVSDIGEFVGDVFEEPQVIASPELIRFTRSSSWTLPSSGPDSLSLPGGVSVGPDMSIYIADYGNHRIQKFSVDGILLGGWGFRGSEPSAFFNPSDVAVDKSGFVYVADTNNHRIQKFTSDGQFIQQWNISNQEGGRLARPTSIAVDKQGLVYVTDFANNKVIQYSTEGVEICRWGVYGNVGGHLMGPYGITVRNGMVYVTDILSSCIKVYDTTGNFISTWGVHGSGEGYLTEPEGISTDPHGNILVGDAGNNRIQIFSPHAEILSNGSIPTIPGLKRPADLVSLNDRKVLISDTGNNRIVILEYEAYHPEDLPLDERYARFSQNMDDWWNKTWEAISTYDL